MSSKPSESLRGTQQAVEKEITPLGLLHLSIVYVVWGSTYLAIRVAVREGSGFPPFTMAAMRVLAAAAILLTLAAVSGKRLRLNWREISILSSSGMLLWVGGNGLVVWAEQRADSSLAALMVGSVPLWTGFMEALLDRKPPSALLMGSLLLGFVGIGVLTAPSLSTGIRADVLSVVALTAAPVFWAGGVIIQSRNPVDLSMRVSSAYQHLFGGLGFLLLVLLTGEPAPAPREEAWMAWGYLVLFGSVITFTSFIQTIRLLPAQIATTYAYVNPVIAVFLGALLLEEQITPWTLFGALLVLVGVAGVFQARRRYRKLA